jgi:hypothetical protein
MPIRPARLLLPLALALTFLPALEGATAAPVSGRLGSPTEHVPALTVYAWSLTGARLHSITMEAGQERYALELPPGRYWLFAAPADPDAPPVYGGYTEFVPCVRDPARRAAHNCTRHGLATVVVGTRRVENLDLTDWYLDDTTLAELDRILGRPGEESPSELELSAPKFSEYPAPPLAGPRAAALRDGGDARIVREHEALTTALGSAPNFAGRFVLVRLGCGERCESAALVELTTGRVAFPAALASLPARGPCMEHGALQFRRDSRLLTVTAREGEQLVTHYYVSDGDSGALRAVATLANALKERCVPRG